MGLIKLNSNHNKIYRILILTILLLFRSIVIKMHKVKLKVKSHYQNSSKKNHTTTIKLTRKKIAKKYKKSSKLYNNKT